MKSIKVENIAMGSSGVARILTVMGGYKRIPAFSMSERKGAVLLGQKSEETTLWKLLELDIKAYTFIKWHGVFPFLYLYISSWGPPVSTKNVEAHALLVYGLSASGSCSVLYFLQR